MEAIYSPLYLTRLTRPELGRQTVLGISVNISLVGENAYVTIFTPGQLQTHSRTVKQTFHSQMLSTSLWVFPHVMSFDKTLLCSHDSITVLKPHIWSDCSPATIEEEEELSSTSPSLQILRQAAKVAKWKASTAKILPYYKNKTNSICTVGCLNYLCQTNVKPMYKGWHAYANEPTYEGYPSC